MHALSIKKGTSAAQSSCTSKQFKQIPASMQLGEIWVLCYGNREKIRKLDTALNRLYGWTAATEAFGAIMAMY